MTLNTSLVLSLSFFFLSSCTPEVQGNFCVHRAENTLGLWEITIYFTFISYLPLTYRLLNQWESWFCDHAVSHQALLAFNSNHTSYWLCFCVSVCEQATHPWSQCCLKLCNITCLFSRPWSDFQTNKWEHYVPGPVLRTLHKALSLVSKQPWEVHFMISSILQNVKLMKCCSWNMKCPQQFHVFEHSVSSWWCCLETLCILW